MSYDDDDDDNIEVNPMTVCFGLKREDKSYFGCSLENNIEMWYIATYIMNNMEKY